MPELPEVETVRRGLEEVLPGRRAERVRVTGRRTVRRQPRAEMVRRLEGRSFSRVDRRGKFLALPLDSGDALVIHLRMTGQLLHVTEPAAVPKRPHTHVVMGLDDGTELRFVDPRTFGEWYVTGEVDEDGLPTDLARLGPDPLVDGISVGLLRERLAGRHTPLKAALTDQRVIAGIGSIYADELCHAARVRPDRLTDTLSDDETRAVARAIRSVLRRAVERRGSSLRDAQYVDLMGQPGTYQSDHGVYDRAGEPCSRCGAEIRRVRFGARTAYCCVACQV